jgi:acyl dehydratase
MKGMISEALGTGFGIYEGQVDPDAAYAFGMATNDPNPRYEDGRAVPPLVTSILVLDAEHESEEWSRQRQLIAGATGSVHGEHDVFYWSPVKPGMPLRWQAAPFGLEQRKSGVVAIQRILVTDLDGAPLVEHFWTSFYINGSVEADFGSPAPDHVFPESSRGRPVGSRSVAVARDQAFRYAGVSGDRVGHAIDDEIARSEGYPGKILQGMCTFGLCSGAIVDIGCDGEVSRLRRLAGRFSAPAFPGKDLVVTAYDAGLTADGHRTLAFEAVQDGVTVVKHGRAEFAG